MIIKYFILFGFALLCASRPVTAFAQLDTLHRIIPGRTNGAQQLEKPYVILISADGFRWDYVQKYKAKNLLKLAGEGVQAESMIPSFPASTVANHFTLVSGLYPAHSGIVGNTFYDPNRKERFKGSDSTWFGEEPIWVTAEKQQMLTASFFWINSQAAIKGIRPTYSFRPYPIRNVRVEERVDALRKWLSLPKENRPHFIACYMNDTDHAGHQFGPESAEVEKAVQYIDDAVGQMVAAAKESNLPVNFIFVSDHGMTPVDREHPLSVPKSVINDKFVVVSQGNYVCLHAKDAEDIMPMYEKLKAENAPGYSVVLKKDLPANIHFGPADDKYNRIGDILLMAKFPQVFTPKPKGPRGAHGFSGYESKDVHATFIAWGPAFKTGLKVPTFENTEVYNVMTRILGVNGLPNDGKGTLAEEILK